MRQPEANIIINLEQENARLRTALKVCKGFFEELGLAEDSVTYAFVCRALGEGEAE